MTTVPVRYQKYRYQKTEKSSTSTEYTCLVPVLSIKYSSLIHTTWLKITHEPSLIRKTGHITYDLKQQSSSLSSI
ncbi:hypothetical protein HanOQP8_Chr15g0586921 [Helianthus annuus]|nr:hypothetical protein HanLR1_Chr15g0590151 [Helianthus annuus]KAJ0653739.1 hypothetical protein HanOQP8_Chr15g0586921 [Helianthus annuus]